MNILDKIDACDLFKLHKEFAIISVIKKEAGQK